jgi:hypothetical protein
LAEIGHCIFPGGRAAKWATYKSSNWRHGGATAPNLRAKHERKGIMPDETTFELASVQFGAEPVAVFRFGYERFELRARLGPGNLEHAIAEAAEVAASVFARWSHEALAFAQRVRAGEDGGPVHH